MKRQIIAFITILSLLPGVVHAQSIVNTSHNLSVSGPGTVKAASETEICIFCHTPHNSRPVAPLWNRSDPGATYTLYASSTLQALPGQPDGASILCLSCHDGTVALGSILSRPDGISMAGGNFMPAGLSNLTTNLRNDHPISFVYDAALAATDGQLNDPAALTPPLSLKNGKMQCTSCHDPHKNIYSDFLVVPPQNSNLCNSCHRRTNWTASTHSTSVKTWNGTAPDPWPYTDPSMTTVAQNGCESCHNPHNSGGNAMLLKYQAEENNCLDCHNGNVAGKNISAQLVKAYKHNVSGYIGVHDANESASVSSMHVECSDCHNPHASNAQTAVAPAVNGFLAGVTGVNQNGEKVNPAVNSYEICYRCHAGNPGSPPAATPRVISQNNVSLEFAPGNPSYHAVAAPGGNPSVPSLISPWTTSSRMYCTDCHASDGAGSPAGPHGSIYPHILKRQYITTENAQESSSTYALCYGCHDRTRLRDDVSFKEHSKHMALTSCNTCHDPHGVSSTQGANGTNNSNLINFRTGVVTASSGNGAIRFEDLGVNTGRCYLTCHGENHNGWRY